ncbi:MAG: [citrate (pro-3S)-lyase] ligase [Liquorilactobacillus mali]|uniref:[citrate (pro-3S)-lyase] ligase n=1 Tax=Liquorilactobacillus mali TaxID=1618 RepID=UPI0039ED13C1
MTERIQDIYLSNKSAKEEWMAFLKKRGIKNFAESETKLIEQTIGLFDEQDRLVATGSIANNVIKYVAVCDIGAHNKGARFNKIISEIESRLAQLNKFHYFVFTKPRYQTSFEYIGFKALAATEFGVILEKGTPNVDDYLDEIPRFDAGNKIASIVMNANPFTNGHRYLVEKAAKENDYVYVFVVKQDASLFKTAERLELVKEGTADLENVAVINGGDYMVSFVSFPAYFIKNTDKIIKYQTLLDARIFRTQIIKPLGITSRYLGNEPLSHTTDLYNEALQKELGAEIDVVIVDRLEVDKEVVSATKVREAIAEGDVNKCLKYIPSTTAAYITANLDRLQLRIKKGQRIDGN